MREGGGSPPEKLAKESLSFTNRTAAMDGYSLEVVRHPGEVFYNDPPLRKKFDVSVKLNVRGSGTKDTARFTIKPTLVRACSALPIVLGTQRASDCLGVPFFCLNAERQLYEDGEVIDQLLLIDAQGNGKTIGTNQVLKLQYGINAVSSKHTGNK